MSHPVLRRSLLVVLVLLAALVVSSAAPAASRPVQGSNEFALKPPPFISVAQAQEGVDAFPQDEAGISAYFRAPFSISIADVRPVFRTIEVETNDFIIGSVPVPDYSESQDVHVYVHRDGWFLSYYPVADPSGKIIDWRVYNSSGRSTLSTKLESGLSVVAQPVGVTPTGITFYDFRYPNANRLMLVVDWTQDTDTYQVNLPSQLGYFERSWAFGTEYRGKLELNGQQLTSSTSEGWQTAQGVLTAVQLPPSQFNTFTVSRTSCCGYDTYGGLVLVYRVP
jgi:hypothetical protein